MSDPSDTDDEPTADTNRDVRHSNPDADPDPDAAPDAAPDVDREDELDPNTEPNTDVDAGGSEPAGEPDRSRTADADAHEAAGPDRGTTDADRGTADTDRGTTDADRAATDPDRTGAEAHRPETVTDTSATDGEPARPASDRNATASGHLPGEPGRGEGTTPASLDVMKWLSGIAALVGAWIAVSPLVYGADQAVLWNNLAVGGAIFALAGYNFYLINGEYAPDTGGSVLVVLLGLWSIVAPFLLAFGSQPLAWSTMASGVAVAVLEGYNAYETRRTEADATVGSRA